MIRVAVVGANGQVGAELCLLLAKRPNIELVAICRNRSGSAFLRWHGIACRHGRLADRHDAPRLIADCDFIVNSALASGTPAQIRRTEDLLIRNLFACSKSDARIIHFSTQSVYGDPRPYRWIRRLNPYGRAKLASERRVRAEQRAWRKPAYILRLGHVCGSLQDISTSIRDSILAGTVVLPQQDLSSNTVYTAAILGAIEQIARGVPAPGTYDLMNFPRWSWREVYEYEARQCNGTLRPLIGIASPRRSRIPALKGAFPRLVALAASAAPVRELGKQVFALLPDAANARAMAWWYLRRARTEISALIRAPIPAEHLSWVANGVRFFPAELQTMELLALCSTTPVTARSVLSWPEDLPDAATAPGGDQQISGGAKYPQGDRELLGHDAANGRTETQVSASHANE